MSYFVYALRSTTRDYIYIGISNDVQRRLTEHNRGYNRTTKPYRPFVLIHTEEFPDRILARQREKELKTTKGRRFLKSKVEATDAIKLGALGIDVPEEKIYYEDAAREEDDEFDERGWFGPLLFGQNYKKLRKRVYSL